MQTLSIIIPAYNEAKRLPRTLKLLNEAIESQTFAQVVLKEIILVDDGSKDETANLAESYSWKVIHVKPNAGKGNAIHEGLKNSNSDLCLIADADSATPWEEFKKLYAAIIKTPIAIGSRDLPESNVKTHQSWIREHMGKTFNLIVRLITNLPFKDTQCGFKLIRRNEIQNFIHQLNTKRFAWDVEFLMFARHHKLQITEVPVTWEHQDHSHVDPIKDASEMFLRVIQIRLRLLFLKS